MGAIFKGSASKQNGKQRTIEDGKQRTSKVISKIRF